MINKFDKIFVKGKFIHILKVGVKRVERIIGTRKRTEYKYLN